MGSSFEPNNPSRIKPTKDKFEKHLTRVEHIGNPTIPLRQFIKFASQLYTDLVRFEDTVSLRLHATQCLRTFPIKYNRPPSEIVDGKHMVPKENGHLNLIQSICT